MGSERITIADIEAGIRNGGYRFNWYDRVRKVRGSSWQGRVVGFYSTTLTPYGLCVESEREPGSVQIYPEAALAPHPLQATPVAGHESGSATDKPDDIEALAKVLENRKTRTAFGSMGLYTETDAKIDKKIAAALRRLAGDRDIAQEAWVNENERAENLKARVAVLEAKLRHISLASQDSGTTKEDLGCEARAALAEGGR